MKKLSTSLVVFLVFSQAFGNAYDANGYRPEYHQNYAHQRDPNMNAPNGNYRPNYYQEQERNNYVNQDYNQQRQYQPNQQYYGNPGPNNYGSQYPPQGQYRGEQNYQYNQDQQYQRYYNHPDNQYRAPQGQPNYQQQQYYQGQGQPQQPQYDPRMKMPENPQQQQYQYNPQQQQQYYQNPQYEQRNYQQHPQESRQYEADNMNRQQQQQQYQQPPPPQYQQTVQSAPTPKPEYQEVPRQEYQEIPRQVETQESPRQIETPEVPQQEVQEVVIEQVQEVIEPISSSEEIKEEIREEIREEMIEEPVQVQSEVIEQQEVVPQESEQISYSEAPVNNYYYNSNVEEEAADGSDSENIANDEPQEAQVDEVEDRQMIFDEEPQQDNVFVSQEVSDDESNDNLEVQQATFEEPQDEVVQDSPVPEPTDAQEFTRPSEVIEEPSEPVQMHSEPQQEQKQDDSDDFDLSDFDGPVLTDEQLREQERRSEFYQESFHPYEQVRIEVIATEDIEEPKEAEPVQEIDEVVAEPEPVNYQSSYDQVNEPAYSEDSQTVDQDADNYYSPEYHQYVNDNDYNYEADVQHDDMYDEDGERQEDYQDYYQYDNEAQDDQYVESYQDNQVADDSQYDQQTSYNDYADEQYTQQQIDEEPVYHQQADEEPVYQQQVYEEPVQYQQVPEVQQEERIMTEVVYTAEPVVEKTQPREEIQREEVRREVRREEKLNLEAIHQSQNYYRFEEERSGDALENLFSNVLAPLYRQIKSSYYLSLTCKVVGGLMVGMILVRIIMNMFSPRAGKEAILREVRELKNQIKNIQEPSKDLTSTLLEIKTEVQNLTQTVAKNEVNNSSLLREKRRVDSFVLEFQTEVMESHKALWSELHSLRKSLAAEKSRPTVKIPGKPKFSEENSSAFLKTAATVPEDDDQKTVRSNRPSIFSKMDNGSAEKSKKPSPSKDNFSAMLEAESPLTQLIQKSNRSGSVASGENFPPRVLTNSTNQQPRMLPSQRLVMNAAKSVGPQSAQIKTTNKVY